MVGSNGCLREPSPATDLDGIMASHGWDLEAARTATGFVTVEEYSFTSCGNLRRLPELAKQHSSTVTDANR